MTISTANLNRSLTVSRIFALSPEGRQIDFEQLKNQIGLGNILAISGGRKVVGESTVIFPVANQFFVTVTLNVWDLYDVKLVKANKNKATIKKEWSDVGAENISEVAYQASCFNNDF